MPADKRDLSEWHTDTFVSGPSWEEFSRAMGIGGDSPSKTAGSVYSVSYYRPAPGHREELEKMLSETPSATGDTTAGNILMQHLEGADWTFLTIARYNSWDDFATGEKTPWRRLRRRIVPGSVCATIPHFIRTLSQIVLLRKLTRCFI